MPRKRSTPKLLHRAMELRHQATPAEKQLWARLRLMRKEDGIHFRRQHAIDKYITDFCSPRKKLVIELDGSQHGGASDIERTTFLESQGYRVLRFWNRQVMDDIEGVLDVIKRMLEDAGWGMRRIILPIHLLPKITLQDKEGGCRIGTSWLVVF